MTRLMLSGVGFKGPGSPDWRHARTRLALEPGPLGGSPPAGRGDCLPAAERRRATPATRLALDVALEALGPHDSAQTTSIFTSSGGEAGVTHGLFLALCEAHPQLSPTAFHQSVHNTAAGYFGIASGSHQPSDSLCAFDDSLGAGFAESALRVELGETDVLLVAFDLAPPFPIRAHRRIEEDLAVAFHFHQAAVAPLADLDVRFMPSAHRPARHAFVNNPLECVYPLLRAIARRESFEFSLGCGLGGQLAIRLSPR